jgi:hypothetical protein
MMGALMVEQGSNGPNSRLVGAAHLQERHQRSASLRFGQLDVHCGASNKALPLRRRRDGTENLRI